MIILWCLSNMESFRSVEDRFGVTKSSCWAILYRICHRILAVNDHFKIISWLRGERALAIMQSFLEICGLRGVLGCIDGSHIKFLPPQNYANSYCNRKSFHSILMRGICDNNTLCKRLFRRSGFNAEKYIFIVFLKSLISLQE